jgi:signal transduction histidine kinase
MRIVTKLLLPTFLLLFLVAGATTYLSLQMRETKRALEAGAASIRHINVLSRGLNELTDRIVRNLLLYQFDRAPVRIESMAQAQAQIENLLNGFYNADLPPKAIQLAEAYASQRDEEARLRFDLLSAVNANDRERIDSALNRWLIRTRHSEATLDDLLTFLTNEIERTTTELNRGWLRNQILALTLLGIILALVGASAFYYVRIVSRPIRRLSAAAGEIARGNVHAPITGFSGSDEITALARAFKDMTEKLVDANAGLERKVAERTAELERSNRGLESEMTQRRLAEQEIAARNRDLETLLYVVSHDLREPLRSIESFARMVSDRYGEKLDDKGRDFLARVTRGGQRLTALLDDILTLSRAQRQSLAAEEIDSRAIVEEILRRLERRISETGATIRVAGDLPKLYVDKTWATQALFNLTANALKFTRNGEPPEIDIERYAPGNGSTEVGIAVRDRGPGVPPDQTRRIFQLFQRAVGREIEGTGAGLAIVQQVAERHGGRVWYQPRPEGGAEFIITFPGAERSTIARENRV